MKHITPSLFRAITLIAALYSLSVLSGCAEAASSGKKVDIPTVRIDCTSASCTASNRTPTILGFVTTSGCDSPSIGTVRAMSTTSISCNTTTGCSGLLSNWVDQSGTEDESVPSGTYSICVVIDYDGNYDGSSPGQSGDSYGELNDVAMGEPPTNQFVTSFSDIP